MSSYISHLDLQTAFNRIINRACIPVWYTKGFNPHIKLVFSTPLSVGTQSVCEYLDIRINREISCEDIVKKLNAEMTDEFYITDAYYPQNDFSEIAYATYEIRIHSEDMAENDAEKVQSLLTTSPLIMTKKSKSGEKEVDIISLINSVEASYDKEDDCIVINATVRASSKEYLNPELLVTAIRQNLGLLCTDPMKEHYSIMRLELLKEDLSIFR